MKQVIVRKVKNDEHHLFLDIETDPEYYLGRVYREDIKSALGKVSDSFRRQFPALSDLP